MQEVQLDGTLSLTCSFDGIPTPSVVWLHNGTIELTDSDSRVSISNAPEGGSNPAARRTVLTVSDIRRDDGGVYTCRFNISDEVFSINATTVLILSESDVDVICKDRTLLFLLCSPPWAHY